MSDGSLSVHMHHSVEKSPKQDVGEQTADQAAGEQQTSGFEALAPPPARLQDEQQGEEEWGQEVEDEAVQTRQPQDARCCARQRRHGRPAVIQHGRVAPHGDLADELRPLAFGHDGRHLLLDLLAGSASSGNCVWCMAVEVSKAHHTFIFRL